MLPEHAVVVFLLLLGLLVASGHLCVDHGFDLDQVVRQDAIHVALLQLLREILRVLPRYNVNLLVHHDSLLLLLLFLLFLALVAF